MDSESVQTKVVKGILWIKANGAMMGYLNASNPFDPKGWYCTGDEVDVDGEWLRIRGRKSDVIIVGGEKVHPQEVEEVLLELDAIEDVAVQGEPHPIVGQIVTARIRPRVPRTRNRCCGRCGGTAGPGWLHTRSQSR